MRVRRGTEEEGTLSFSATQLLRFWTFGHGQNISLLASSFQLSLVSIAAVQSIPKMIRLNKSILTKESSQKVLENTAEMA